MGVRELVLAGLWETEKPRSKYCPPSSPSEPSPGTLASLHEAACHCEALWSRVNDGPPGLWGNGEGMARRGPQRGQEAQSGPSHKRAAGVRVCVCVTVSGRYVRVGHGGSPERAPGDPDMQVRGKPSSHSGCFCTFEFTFAYISFSKQLKNQTPQKRLEDSTRPSPPLPPTPAHFPGLRADPTFCFS